MTQLNLATEVLEWAADQIGETLEGVASALTSKKDTQDAIQRGRLTPKQAENFAAKTRVPFGFLFLPSPPKITATSVPDLRQTSDAGPLSADFQDVLQDAERKQQWYREHLVRSGERPCELVGKFKRALEPEAVAHFLVKALKLTPQLRAKVATQDQYFSLLAQSVEDLGILVLKSGIVRSNTKRSLSLKEFRGFALLDDYAPLVFINGADWQIAWAFTLIHEVAHVLIGQEGVSDQERGRKHPSEVFCNAVAGEVLVPHDEFIEHFNEMDLGDLAKHFRVSRLVVARRALEFKKISLEDYRKVETASRKDKAKESGGNPYATIPIRNSKLLTRAIVYSALNGTTTFRDAASILNVRPGTVIELGRRLTSNE